MELEQEQDEDAETPLPAGASLDELPEWAYFLGGWLAPMQSYVPDKLCMQHSRAYLEQLNKAQPWALSMYDASGKIPDGFFDGNNNMLGSWDECLGVTAQLNQTVYPNITRPTFRGQYCLAHIVPKTALPTTGGGLGVVPILPVPAVATSVSKNPSGLRYGYCIPSSCSEVDATISLNIWLMMQNNTPLAAYVADGDCHTGDELQTFETNDIVVIVIMAVFGLIIATCTTLDVVGLYVSRRSPSADDGIIGQPATFPPANWRIVKAFSLRFNGKKLLGTKTGSDNLGCIHGMRFLSMTWVVLGHNYLFAYFYGAWINPAYVQEIVKAPALEPILNGLLSVDTFFCLGGIMVAYTFMKMVASNGGKIRWHDVPMMYLHRYLRLTPVYAITIALTATLARRIGKAPTLASTMNYQAQMCQDNWWKNLLYVNNYFDSQTMCIGQTWYLPVDFQLFLASPFMILPFVFNKKIGAAWLALIALVSVIVPGWITYHEDLPPTLLFFNTHAQASTGTFFSDFYITPWCRASPYVVGIALGLLLHDIKVNKVNIRIPQVVNLLIWAVMATIGLLVVYGTHHWNKDPLATWTTAQAVAYGALHRFAWGVAVCWVVFACVTGYGGFVDTLLSYKGFIPLGRLTYTTYLVALQIQTWYFASFKGTSRYDNTLMVYTFLSNLIVSVVIAAILSLGFESPMMSIEKIIFPQRRTKTSPKPVVLGDTPHETVTRF